MSKIVLEPLKHRGQQRLLVKFAYNAKLIAVIKKVEGAAWSQTHKSWHVEDSPEKIKEVVNVFKGLAEVDVSIAYERIPFLRDRTPVGSSKLETVKGGQGETVKGGMGEDGHLLLRNVKSGHLLLRNVKNGHMGEEKSKIVTQRDTEDSQRGRERKENAEFRIKNEELKSKKENAEFSPSTVLRGTMQNSELKSKIVTQSATEDSQKGTERKENAELKSEKCNPSTDTSTPLSVRLRGTMKNSELKSKIVTQRDTERKENAEFRIKNEELKSKKINVECRTGKGEVPKEIGDGLKKLKQWMAHKRYSDNTIKTYLDGAKSFFMFVHPKPLNTVGNDDVLRYVNEYILKNGLSFSYQNQVVTAVKLFFREIEQSKIDIDKLERPRRQHKLPNVLSKEEVAAILRVPRNIKHKAMLSLIYSCGLRRSELLNLKSTDVDSKRNLLIIRNAKGYKDRVAPLSQKIIEMLRNYYKMYKPKVWLFEGQEAREQYSATSLQNVFKHALSETKIKRNATLHWLRHSYATHLLEGGTDLRYIQEILGHKNSKTTEIYTHVSNKSIQRIKSPFDELDI